MVNCGCASKTHADIDLHADTAGSHGSHHTKVAPPTTSRVATEAGTTQPGPLSLKECRPDALTTNANYGVRKSSEEDDCGVGFVSPLDAGQQVTDAVDDARHACGPLGSDHVAVALTLAILFQHTVCAAEGQFAFVCGLVSTLVAVVTVGAQLLRAFVLDTAAREATIKADESAKLLARREAADAHHKKLCAKLEETANLLDDDKYLSEQGYVWQQIVDQIEALERSWIVLRDVIRTAEYTRAQRRWADIRRLAKQLVEGSLSNQDARVDSVVAAVQAHPLYTAQKKASSIDSVDVALPLSADMNKLGAGTQNLKALRSTWATRTFELTTAGLEWRLTTSESGALHPNTRFVKPHELGSVEEWTGSLGGVKVEYGLQIEVVRDNARMPRFVYIDTMSADRQREWYHGLHHVLSNATDDEQSDIEFTRSCKPRGVELGRNRVVQFVLQGKHGKMLVQATLERARLDFDTADGGYRQLYPGLQIRVRGTAVGKKLPSAPVNSYQRLDRLKRKMALTTFFLQKEAGNLDIRESNPDTGVKLLERVAAKVKEKELQIELMTRDHKKGENEAYRKICKELAFVDHGVTIDPESTRKLVWEREHATWYDPRDTKIWGDLSCIETPVTTGELEASPVPDLKSSRSGSKDSRDKIEPDVYDDGPRFPVARGFGTVQPQLIDGLRAAGQYNVLSPWVKAVKGDRCFYYRRSGSKQSAEVLEVDTETFECSLTPQQEEGVRAVEVVEDDDEEFEKQYARAVVEAEPGICVYHQLTNKSPYRLATNRDEKEEYVGSGTWSKHAPPPRTIEPGETKRWGSTSINGLLGPSGSSASIVYRGAWPNEHKTKEPVGIRRHSSEALTGGNDGFDLILSHDCPATGFAPRSAPDNRAAGVIHHSCPAPYSSEFPEFMRRHHKSTVHGLGTSRSRCDKNYVEISVQSTKGPSRRKDGSKVMMIHWTLTPFKMGTEEKQALQTAATLVAPDKLHRVTWMLDNLLPATENDNGASGKGVLAQFSKEYWIETFAAAVFDRAGLPRGVGSGWLQVQVAPGDSFGLGLKTTWLDVNAELRTQTVQVGGATPKYAGPEDLLTLCGDQFKIRFAQTGNWRDKLVQAMTDHSPDPAADQSTSWNARMAAFADEAEELQMTEKDTEPSIGDPITQLPGAGLLVPHTTGEAKLAGANTPVEGLLQALEWKAIAWVQTARSKFEAMRTLDPREVEKYNKAQAAIAAQWLTARTPAEVASANKLKVTPKLMHEIPAVQVHFDKSAALKDRRDWSHWQQANTGDVLMWVLEEYLDNVLSKKYMEKLKAKFQSAVREQTARLNDKLGMVLIVQTTMLSHGKTEQLLAYYVSIAHIAVAALKQVANETATKLGVDQTHLGVKSTGVLITQASNWYAEWWTVFEANSGRHFGITAIVLALGLLLEVGRAEYEAHLSNSDTYEANIFNKCGRRYYLICWRLLLICTTAVQIKCYNNIADYAMKFVVTVCLVALYRKLRSGISVILTLCIVASSCAFGFDHLLNEEIRRDVSYGLRGSEASRPVLVLVHAISNSTGSVLALAFDQIREHAVVVFLQTCFAIGPDVMEFCWWQQSLDKIAERKWSAQSRPALRLDSRAVLCARVCRRLGHSYFVFVTFLWLGCFGLNSRDITERCMPLRLISEGMSDAVHQTVVVAALGAVCARLIEAPLALIARFVFACLSLWRSIINSASAIVFVVLVAKSGHNIKAVLHEALAPLPPA